jgi:hypothetical protein
MLVTPVVNQALEETLVRLKRYNRRITLISLDQELPRDLPGMQIVHAPFAMGKLA